MVQSDFFRCFCQQTLWFFLWFISNQVLPKAHVLILCQSLSSLSACLFPPVCRFTYFSSFRRNFFFLGHFCCSSIWDISSFLFFDQLALHSATPEIHLNYLHLWEFFLFCSEVVHVSESRVKSTFYKQKIHPISILNRNFSFYTAQRAHTFFFHAFFLEVFSLYWSDTEIWMLVH